MKGLNFNGYPNFKDFSLKKTTTKTRTTTIKATTRELLIKTRLLKPSSENEKSLTWKSETTPLAKTERGSNL